MAKILIVGDVHGRKFWHKAEELVNQVDKVIFLGDYLDPYDVSENDALEEFKSIVKFYNDNSDKVIMLIGNHDCEYIWPEIFQDTCRHCYSIEKEARVLMQNALNLRLIYRMDNYLFSHAGVNKSWLEFIKEYYEEITLEDLESFNFNIKTLNQIGFRRRGYSRCPSCVWADILEHEIGSLDYYQIFGHTQLIREYIGEKCACLDCRKCFILNTDTGEITSASEEISESIE